MRKQGSFSGLSEKAFIHPQAVIGPNCTIHPHAHVGARTRLDEGCVLFPGVYVGEDCHIGKGCVLYPNAVVLAGITLGEGCVLHPGCVLGADGFGFAVMDGEMRKIPQIGSVSLAAGVDVGANACIDRATLGATRVGRDSKIDNLVQIGHNVELGEQCLVISQVGIAGSTKVGSRVTMAGQAGIAGHLSIGDGVTIGPQSGVAKDIPAGVKGGGTPFMEGKSFMRNVVLAPKVPDLFLRVQQMEKELNALKEKIAELSNETLPSFPSSPGHTKENA